MPSGRPNWYDTPTAYNCPTGKYPLTSKASAKRKERETRGTYGKRRIYRCHECDAFHLTTMSYMEQVAAGLHDADQ